jgi:hypothetical protein
MHFGQISTNIMKRVGFYVGAPHHHDTSLQDNDGTTKSFSYPSGMCIVALESLHCVYGKKTGRFCSKLRQEKPIFECMIGERRFVVFPSNEYNDGHPYLRQGLLVVLAPMIVWMMPVLSSGAFSHPSRSKDLSSSTGKSWHCYC